MLAAYREAGHVTVPGVFAPAEMDALVADIECWGEEFLADLPVDQRRWYVDAGASRPRGDAGVKARDVLRKLDNPHHHRASVGALAHDPRLVRLVESFIGPGVSVYFSQVFFKAPEGGGPKPAHQDNFYFGPRDPEALVTAWVALDDATPENGCLYFGDGTHRFAVMPHIAPEGEPFNLQIPVQALSPLKMSAAPVPKGGVSFHHGGTVHQSGVNLSTRWRRACALHYVSNANAFTSPALPYDAQAFLRIT